MTLTNRPVTSREYKLMLRVDRFTDRKRGTRSFWRLVRFLLVKQGVDVSRQIQEQKDVEVRRTWYVDTPGLDLRKRGFVVRQREEQNGKVDYKTTLKFRDSDRYVAAAQDCSSTQDSKSKFEEDIIPTFVSRFANSTSFRTKKPPRLESMHDIVALFPGLERLEISGGTWVQRVNAFEAYEVVRSLGNVHLAPEAEVKCCLSFWYLMDGRDELPLVAEFSFDYDLPNKDKITDGALEQFPADVVRAANRLFRGLQRHDNWINFNGTTKTAFAYDGL